VVGHTALAVSICDILTTSHLVVDYLLVRQA